MGRAPKTGLTYFPRDVDYYDDFKIMDLLNEYGPLGQTIYDVLLCMIYHEGYYLEVPSMQHLAARIIKAIGNRWIKKKDFVLQVIYYCADIGLFDYDLLNQNIITSAGIQRRYAEVTVRNKVNKDKYWLLDKKGQPLLSAPQNAISATETAISATEKTINEAEMQQKKSKLNNIIYYFENPELDHAFKEYIAMRPEITPGQIEALKNELLRLSDDANDRLEIVRKAYASGWKSFYPIKKKNREGSKEKPVASKNQFHNFDQREYNYKELEQRFINRVNGKEMES